MTQVVFDVVDLVGEVHPGDQVSVWPPHVTSTVDGRVQSTRKIDVPVDEGPVTEDIEPGPLVVQLRCKGITDTKPRTVTVPDEGTITLANLLQSTFTYTPTVVSQVALDAQRAEDAADRAETTVGSAEAVIEARDDTVAAVATLGDAQTVLGARDQAVQAAGDASAAATATLGDAQAALTARDEAVTAAGDAEQIATTLPTTIQSELDTRVPPAVSTALANDPTVQAGADQAVSDAVVGLDLMERTTAEGLIDAAKWRRGNLAVGVSVDTLVGSASAGVWSVGSSAPGLPKATPGVVEVTYDGYAGRTRQTFSPSSPTEIGRWERDYSGGVWGSWRPTRWMSNEISTGSLDAIVLPGYYSVTSSSAVAGLPSAYVGVLEVMKAGLSLAQRYTTFEENSPVIWQRVQHAGTWGQWFRSTAGRRSLIWSTATSSRPGAEILSALTKDRLVGLNNYASTLRITRDEGVTWTDVHAFSGQSMESVTPLTNGEVLVSTTDGGQLRRVYRSTGFAIDPAAATWDVVLGPFKHMVKVSPGWSISEHDNIVLINEYGPKAGLPWGSVTEVAEGDNARYTYLSLDYGKTWSTIFDLNAWLIANGQNTLRRHLHGVAWDPYWDRIWLTFGDNGGGTGSNGVLYSDDLGATWQTAWHFTGTGETWQVVGILPMPDCVLFAGDMYPSGLMRLDRRGGKLRSNWDFTVAYQHPTGKHLCQYINKIKLESGEVVGLFAFCAEGAVSPSFVIGTRDGVKIDLLWEDPEAQPSGMGLRSIVGPTLRGKLVAGHNDLRVAGQWTEVSGRADVY